MPLGTELQNVLTRSATYTTRDNKSLPILYFDLRLKN